MTPHTTPEVIVVGLGAMGSAVLHELARAGVRALGIDRFAPPHDQGSSFGHARLTREAYYEDPLYVPLVRRASELFVRLEEESGCGSVRIEAGAVMLGALDSEVVQGTLHSARTHGVPHEAMTGDVFMQRFPMFVSPPGMHAVFEPGAAMLRPERIIAAQLQRARALGATVLLHQIASEWTQDGSGVAVRVGDEWIRAGQIVLCAGAWMPTLLANRVPLVVERQIQHWWRPDHEPARFTVGAMPSTLWQHDDGSILYTMPDAGDGVKVAWHHGGEMTTADTLNRTVTEAEHALIAEIVKTRLAQAGGRSVATSVCMYTNTPDGHFVIDRLPDAPQAVVVSACSGHGFKFSSAVGEAVSQMVQGQRPALSLDAFRISRFG